jgi:hypothetical protein
VPSATSLLPPASCLLPSLGIELPPTEETLTVRVPIPSPGAPLLYGIADAPLVIVLNDRFGRLRWLEPYSAALAGRGLRVVVPDLYGGFCTFDSKAAA